MPGKAGDNVYYRQQDRSEASAEEDIPGPPEAARLDVVKIANPLRDFHGSNIFLVSIWSPKIFFRLR